MYLSKDIKDKEQLKLIVSLKDISAETEIQTHMAYNNLEFGALRLLNVPM